MSEPQKVLEAKNGTDLIYHQVVYGGARTMRADGRRGKIVFFSFSAMLLNGRVYADDFALKRLNMEMLLIYF